MNAPHSTTDYNRRFNTVDSVSRGEIPESVAGKQAHTDSALPNVKVIFLMKNVIWKP
jgi:hypothetical protein